MNRILLLFFSFFLLNTLQAQVGGGFSVGYRGGMMRSKTFSQFRDGYNELYKAQSEKGLSGFGLGSGYALNGDINANGFVAALRFSHYQTKDRIRFNSGGERTFKLEETYFTMAMGGGIQAKRAHFNLTLGMIVGRNEIEGSYQYTNGMVSYGGERTLNGIYKTMRVGGSARMEFSFLFFYFGTEYIFGSNKSKLNDNLRTDGIPTNYPAWLSQPSWDYGDDDFIQADFNGLRFELGLRFQFKDND